MQTMMAVREDPPSFVVLLGSPGGEESLLEAVKETLGDGGVPVIGGSSADNAVKGLWRQIAKCGDMLNVRGLLAVAAAAAAAAM